MTTSCNYRVLIYIMLLVSGFFMNLGMFATIFFCSIFMVAIFINNLRVNGRSIYALALWLVYAAAVISVYFSSDQNLDEKLTIANLVYSLLAVLMVSVLSSEKRIYITKALYYSILLMLFILIVQHVTHFIGYKYLDIHNVITLGKYVSRYESNYLDQFGLLRPTGLSVEPSNFSAVLVYMIFSFAWLRGKLDNKVIVLLFLSSLTLSFASMGIVAAILSVIVMARVIDKKRVFDLAIASTVLLLATIAVLVLIDRITSGVDYDALGSRLKIIEYYYDVDYVKVLWGHGLFFFEDVLTFNSVELSNSHIRDSGVWISIFFAAGVPGVALLGLILTSLKWPLFSLAVAVGLCSKLDFMQPSFWILISVLISFSSARKRHV